MGRVNFSYAEQGITLAIAELLSARPLITEALRENPEKLQKAKESYEKLRKSADSFYDILNELIEIYESEKGVENL